MGQALKRNTWKQDPETVKTDILKVAVREFGEHGLAGARIDEIARKTTTSKRMIYYYFGDKEGLYRSALESEYARFRQAENELVLNHLSPVEALRQLTEFTFEWHRENPDFIRLVVIENAVRGRHLEQSDRARTVNSTIVRNVTELLKRGQASGDFIEGLDPTIVHMLMSGVSFYNMSNRYTFSLNFGLHLRNDDMQLQIRDYLVKAVFGLVLKDPSSATAATG